MKHDSHLDFVIPTDGAVTFGVAFPVLCTIPFPLVSFAILFVAVKARHGIAQLLQLLFARVLYLQLRPLGHLSKVAGGTGSEGGKGGGRRGDFNSSGFASAICP